MNRRTQPFLHFSCAFPVLNLALFRAVIRAFALRTLFHLASFITRITSIGIYCGLPTILFKTITMAWVVVVFLPCRFSKPLQCAKCSTHSSSEFALNGFSQSGHLTILALLSTVSVSMALVCNRFRPPSLGVKVLACLLIPCSSLLKKAVAPHSKIIQQQQ